MVQEKEEKAQSEILPEGTDAPSSSAPEAGSDAGQTASSVSVGEVVGRLEQASSAALATLRRAEPKHKGSDPLYNVPWYLFIGPSSRAVNELLSAAPIEDTLLGPQGGQDPDTWFWWRFRTMIGISWPSALLCSPEDREAWQIVEHAMAILTRARKQQPINGIVVVVPVSDLLRSPSTLLKTAQGLREIVNEMRTTLTLRFPTTVVVTGLEELPGHEALFGALDDTTNQVLGVRLDDGDRDLRVADRMGAAFSEWRERLHALRLSVLRRSNDTTVNRLVFKYVADFEKLEQPLQSLVATMFSESPADNRRPHWRALYLTAPRGGSPHLKDLFDRFLPADASLAKRAS
jgi:type VI secretion system protein ImpL